MHGTRIVDVVGAVGGVAVIVVFVKYGLWPGLGTFGAVWLIAMVISIATTKSKSHAAPSTDAPEFVVTDYRPEWEKAAEVDARSTLDDTEDERYANELVSLLAARDGDRIRQIGKQLDEHGGIRRMVRVCLRVKHLGGDASALERRHWDGIGEWQG